jgi:hypothetical protein
MLELCIGLVALVLVFVFFYKQKAQEFRISQIEYTQLSALGDLLTELNPVVIRGLPMPSFLTPDTLQKNSRLGNFPVGENLTLKTYLDSDEFTLSPQPAELRTTLGNDLGLPMWASHIWFESLTSELWYSFCMNVSAEAYLTGAGLQKTVACSTLIYPTSGTFLCSLLLESSTQFLPTWEGRFLSDFTQADTPLLHEVQYLDIKLRPGHALVIPPHWIFSMQPDASVKKPMFAVVEFHHPISRLAKALA